MLSRAIILFGIIVTSGCLYIPAGSDGSAPEDHEQRINIGSSTKEEVFSFLGPPDITRDNGSIAIYDNSEITGYLIIIEPFILGALYQGSLETLGSTLIQFDENVATVVSPIPDGYGCYTNYVCLDSGWTTLGGPKLIPESTAISSNRDDDKEAKRFGTPAEGCNIYIHAAGNILAEYPILVSIENNSLIPLTADNYLNVQLSEGKLLLKVFHSGTDFITKGEPELLAQAAVTCSKPSIDFLQITYKFGETGPNSRSAKVDLVDQEKGRNEIINRRLLLLP